MATHRFDWRDPLPAECRGGVVTIGNFDGVHRGHAALVATARRQANTTGGPVVALTFDPHPLDILRPASSVPPLTTTEDRCRLLHELGADHVVVLHTTPGLLALGADEFFEHVVVEHLQAQALVEGTTFGFGRRREGNIDTLDRLCRASGGTLTVVAPQQVKGIEVSSSRIRAELLRGNVEQAAALLGRPYRLHGCVVVGVRRGRSIGFPTANLANLTTLAPGDGVYAVRANCQGGGWPAAANVGPNPTFAEAERKVEVHLIGFDANLYDQPLTVDFVCRLRDTKAFNNVADLTAQLRLDIVNAARACGEEQSDD